MTVIARLQGGLGNQLFQYAMARRLACVSGRPLQLELTALQDDPKRKYQLDPFELMDGVTLVREPPSGGAAGLLGRWLRSGDCLEVLREKQFHFDPSVLEYRPRGSVHVVGYWQSESYFRDIEPELRADLRFREAPDLANGRMLEQIGGVEAVSVHFRRGDYVNDPVTEAYHGIPMMDYYHRAVGVMKREVKAAHFFIFSDEPGWVQEHFRLDAACTIVDLNSPDDPTADMRLMSACRHHIAANSSFSWWGAWLNPRPDKIVVVPARWFNKAELDDRDLIPSSWRKL